MIDLVSRRILFASFILTSIHLTTLAKSPMYLQERKDLALFHCLRLNYLQIGFDIYAHDRSSYYKKYAEYKNIVSVEHNLLISDFIKQSTSEYYKEQVSIKNESGRPPPFTAIFGKCMEFYKSKELDKFLRKNRP